MRTVYHCLLPLGLLVLAPPAAGAGECGKASQRWWPVQASPRGLVRTEEQLPEPRPAYEMLVQSVAGLATQAVNRGSGEELVWVATRNVDTEDWYARVLGRPGGPELRAVLGPWQLVERYRRKGIIKGYILYRRDRSRGKTGEHRPGMDQSVNVATSLAGLLGGVLIEEELESMAKRRELPLLLDARGKSPSWCFQTYRDRFNRRLVCVQDPRKPNVRDLAIAQRAFTLYGNDEPIKEVLRWLEPLSPVLGWNGGDEFQTTRLSSEAGHIQTATDWCTNLPVLMGGSERIAVRRPRAFDPRAIDWSDRRGTISFVSTDGDNVQWLEGDFFRNPSYWRDPQRGRMPFGWSCCFAHLAQLAPELIDFAAQTQSRHDSFVEWGGGYYYPDLFASARADRWGLLRRHAQRTWAWMQHSGTAVIGFNVHRFNSEDARKAYQVFADATDGLAGILVFQYDAYEAGAGQVYWVKDSRGVEIPVISARYAIWENQDRPRCGTPARVARVIDSSNRKTPRHDWVCSHVWSYFRRAAGDDPHAEDLPQTDARAKGAVRGYTPSLWCAERLPATVRVVAVEEMIWRIRMEHNGEQTRQELRRLSTAKSGR